MRSYTTNPRHPSMAQLVPFLTPLLRWPLARIVKHMPLGSVCLPLPERSWLIGFRYQNGSILIARLQPSFTVLHTLTTSKGPSPIICLTWHASSSKQKSDMLATQTGDGDLRVWSIAKPPGSDTPRIIRSLKRSETNLRGPKWIAWSKNGRIVQYAER